MFNKFAKVSPTFLRHAFNVQKRSFSNIVLPEVPKDYTNEQIFDIVDKYNSQFEMSKEDSWFGGFGEIIKNNSGYVPFIGLLMASLISKEIFYLDAGAVVLCNTSLVFFTGFVLGGDGAKEALHKFRSEESDYIRNTFNAKRDILRANIEACKSVLGKPQVVRDTYTAFLEANEAVSKSRALVAHKEARDTVVNKLNAIYLQEQAEIAAQRRAIRDQAHKYVLDNINSDAVKASVLKEAISMVGSTEDKTGQFAAVTKLIDEAIKAARK